MIIFLKKKAKSNSIDSLVYTNENNVECKERNQLLLVIKYIFSCI